jgi:hypothetical protein
VNTHIRDNVAGWNQRNNKDFPAKIYTQYSLTALLVDVWSDEMYTNSYEFVVP